MKGRIVYVGIILTLALGIPALLGVESIQSRRFNAVEKEASRLETTQAALVEKNRKLITEISVLSGADRIEKIAVRELGMRKARSGEIIRVEMKGN